MLHSDAVGCLLIPEWSAREWRQSNREMLFIPAEFNQRKTTSARYVTGHPKKSVSWADHLFFGGLYCCFIQTWYINNDWKCDFWHLRCLFYQVESILFHFQQLEFFVFQKFPWNTAKMVKNLQCLKTPQICYLRHAEHYAKNRTSLRGLDHDTLFFGWPVMLFRS